MIYQIYAKPRYSKRVRKHVFWHVFLLLVRNDLKRLLKITVSWETITLANDFKIFLAGESGSADTVRDPRGFAIKMYTEEGLISFF